MTTQDGFAWRFDWGLDGLGALAPVVDVIVIVDVLRFTTAVTAAVERGVSVTPAPFPLDGGPGRAWELSPSLDPGAPGPIAPRTGVAQWGGTHAGRPSIWAAAAVLAGCLANATAVARAVPAARRASVAVIAAGERTGRTTPAHPGRGGGPARRRGGAGRPRPRGVDLGAGVLTGGGGGARAAFVAARPRLPESLRAACPAGSWRRGDSPTTSPTRPSSTPAPPCRCFATAS